MSNTNIYRRFCYSKRLKNIDVGKHSIANRDRPIYRPGQYLGFTDISVSALVGVDKMQTTCARKHNKPSQDSYHVAMLAGAFS